MIKIIVPILILIMLIPFSLLAFTPESELFSEAESRYYSKNYAVAIELYDEFLKAFPLSDLVPDAQYRKAMCLFRLERYSASRTLFDAVERRYRATRYIDYVPFWKGVILYKLADFSGSRNNLESFLKKVYDPDLVSQALLYKALCEISLENFSEARETMAVLLKEKGIAALSSYEVVLSSYILLNIKDFEGLINFQDEADYESLPETWRERALLYRGEALWGKGEIDASEEVYRRLLDADPKTASTSYRRLYIIAQQKQDFSEMEWLIQRAEEKFAGSPGILKDFWLRIGIESFKRLELDLSEYFLNKVWNLRVEGDVQEAVPLYIAEINIQRGDLESARQVLEEFLALSGREPLSVMMRLGNIYIMTEDYSNSAQMFNRIIRVYPDSKQAPGARYLLAYSQYRLSEFGPALENCELLAPEKTEDAFQQGVLRLKALILKKQGKIEAASQALSEYVTAYPDDIRARLDLVKLFFIMKEYEDVISLSFSLPDEHPDIEKTDPYAFMLLIYLRGLSQVAVKSYSSAFDSFTAIPEDRAADMGLSVILPYAQYYRGWASYRMNDFSKAAELFSGFLRSHPSHELYPQALYLSAWCYYSLGDYQKAQTLFSRLAQRTDDNLREKALFLEGKSLSNLKRETEAAGAFKRLLEESPESVFADDALFEYAGILAVKGEIDQAADRYLELYSTYGASSLADEALYKRGEIYFNNKLYTRARSAFHDYRTRFPGGKLIDAALYWEGLSAYELGEIRGASLMWEIIIDSYRKSPFRSDALHKTAEVYVSLGDFQSALALYEELTFTYPEYSEAVNTGLRIEEIRYLVFGLSGREAELTARISNKGGAETREGRKAMIDLSRIYIFEKEGKLERAFQMLSQVLDREDKVTGAEAQFLLGEYYYRTGKPEKAGRAFFRASIMNPGDRDFMAYSIYRAAQMMKQAGKMREVKALVERLEENFSGSEWSDEGKKLLEDSQ